MKAVIVIQEDRKRARRVTKVLTYPDGGFAVFAPYHSSRSGYLLMYDANYMPRLQWVGPGATVKEYTAQDRVKLSYHGDGFVQFSGAGSSIVSGRDEAGNPRGMGLLSQPLTSPITSGPSVGLTLWGLDGFEEHLRRKSGEEVIHFGEADFVGGQYSPPGWNAYCLEFFVLPNVPSEALRSQGGHFRAALQFFNFEVPGTIFVLHLLPLQAYNNMLGVLARRVCQHFAAASGFSLAGPSRILSRDGSSPQARFISAVYPNPTQRDAPSISYVPPNTADQSEG